MAVLDVYMFPCFKCGDGAGQVKKAVTYLHDNKVRFNRFWYAVGRLPFTRQFHVCCARRFDIEGGGTYWGGQAENVAFFEDMKKEITALG